MNEFRNDITRWREELETVKAALEEKINKNDNFKVWKTTC